VAPGGFGEFGDDTCASVVENVHRTNQAVRGFRRVMRMSPEDLLPPPSIEIESSRLKFKVQSR
jgi:hypothetical protein